MAPPVKSAVDKLIEQIKLMMADGIIDNHYDPEHLYLAVELAYDRYNQRSGNAIYENFIFLEIQPEQTVYTLPKEVVNVQEVLRRNTGSAGSGAQLDPFGLAFTNSIFLLQDPSGLSMSGSGAGFMATYEFASDFNSLARRMFGAYLTYIYNRATRELTLQRKFEAQESVMLHVHNTKPLEEILADPYARPWIRDYALACLKEILGNAYERFSNIAGPNGGVSLNGAALKAEAVADKQRLEEELKTFLDADSGWGFIIG